MRPTYLNYYAVLRNISKALETNHSSWGGALVSVFFWSSCSNSQKGRTDLPTYHRNCSDDRWRPDGHQNCSDVWPDRPTLLPCSSSYLWNSWLAMFLLFGSLHFPLQERRCVLQHVDVWFADLSSAASRYYISVSFESLCGVVFILSLNVVLFLNIFVIISPEITNLALTYLPCYLFFGME